MTAAIAEHGRKYVPRTGSTRSGGLRTTFGALAVPNYRIYVGGQAVANTGTWIQNIALDWLVLQLTGSPAAVGIAMALQFTPISSWGCTVAWWPTGTPSARSS